MDALPSLTRLSVGAGTSKDDALPTFAELDALDADETAAAPGYNEQRAPRNERNPDLKESYDVWKAGKPDAGEALSEMEKWEYKWYGDPYEILRRQYGVRSWNPRKVETQGFFDWAPSFWYDWKLVREQESLFAKADLCYSDGTKTDRETFMHPASSVLDVIEQQLQLDPDVWQRMLREGAWIVDFSNMDTPDKKCKDAWSAAYTEAERDGGTGKGVVIAVVKPGSMETRFFHRMQKEEGYVPDYDGQDPEVEGYGRIWKLLQPLASDPRHVFLVVVETWPEEGSTKRKEDGRDIKRCAFYNPDEYTEPQLQERGKEGLGWPKTKESVMGEDEQDGPGPLTREEEVRREKRTPAYRGRYFPLEDSEEGDQKWRPGDLRKQKAKEGDQKWRPGDLRKQKAKVGFLQMARTRLDHGFCEYDDVVCVMLRLWLARKMWERNGRKQDEWPWLDFLLPRPILLGDDTYRVPATRSDGVVTTDKKMNELCHWQTMLKLHNEYFKFNDVFRLRVYRKTSAAERFKRERTDLERQYGPDDDSEMGLRVQQGLEKDKAQRKAAIEEADDRREPERTRFMRESKQQREELKRAQAERNMGRFASPEERQAATDKVEALQLKKDENDKFYQTKYKKTLEEWYNEDVVWPLRHRYGPQDVLKVQNDDIQEPRALYKRNAPAVRLGSPEAKKYIHDLDNVFWEDYGRWYDGSLKYTPPVGQGDPSPEIPEFLEMWRELIAEMIEIDLEERNKTFR